MTKSINGKVWINAHHVRKKKTSNCDRNRKKKNAHWFRCTLNVKWEQRLRSYRMILNIHKIAVLQQKNGVLKCNWTNLYNEQFDFLPKCGKTQFWLLFDYKMRLALRITSSCQKEKRSKRQMKSEANKPKAEETTNKTPPTTTTIIISTICRLLHNATVYMFSIAEISVQEINYWVKPNRVKNRNNCVYKKN